MIAERPRLLVEACLGAAERRREAWDRWLELTGFDEIDSVSMDLLPSVAQLNRGLEFREIGRLNGLFRRNWALNQDRIKRVLPLLCALRARGLDPVPIKGLAVALSTYGSLGGRCFADVDVLVSADRFREAADVAVHCGFTPHSGFSWPRASVKSWSFQSSDGDDVDLHARAMEEPWNTEAEVLMRDQPGTVMISGVGFRILSPAASLVVAIMHGLRFDGRGYCRWLVDAGLLIGQGRVDWDQVDRIATALRVTFAVSSGLCELARFLPHASIPMEPQGARERPLWQRLEHTFRTRPPAGLTGALPNPYFLYLRERSVGLWNDGFPSFLRQVWQIPPGEGLGRLLAQKFLRRTASVLPRREPSRNVLRP